MILRTIRYKNIFSVGNHFVEIDLTKNDKTLIIGTNGVGKSTFISAICMGLYGKPFKEVNKPTIVNSINKKNLLVEIEISSNGKDFLIRRGMKPDVFEVLENGKEWDQNGASKDLQARVEKEILGMNFSTFKQKVVVGSGGYTPFMKLKAAERRTIVENMLDLTVFSRMNVLLKTDIDTNKKEIEANEKESFRNNVEFSASKERIKFLKAQRDKVRVSNEEEKVKVLSEIKKIDDSIQVIDKSLLDFSSTEETAKSIEIMINNLRMAKTKLTSNVETISKTIREIEETDFCPTCQQSIDDKIKHEKSHEFKIDKVDIEKKLPLVDKKIESVLEKQRIVSEDMSKQNQLLTEKRHLILTKNKLTDGLSDLDAISFDDSELLEEAKKYNKLLKSKEKLLSKRDELVDEKEILSVATTLLKDNGVKASIITKYIPFINKTINDYLDIMKFYVQFEIDENFNEVIRSRYRDVFTYENFSEGEKARIDLALLFAWRTVTKVRSNMECNLLVLDEVFDGSLDFDGTEYLLNILDTLEGSNIFVISHKTDIMMEKFQNVIQFEKKNNFTQIKKENEIAE